MIAIALIGLVVLLANQVVFGFKIINNSMRIRCKKLAMADIIDTAVKAGTFKTLATALTKANLVDTLKSRGPFTVFAPTDAAFSKLPRGTLEVLLMDIPALSSILTYHVLNDNYSMERLISKNGKKISTINGNEISITVSSNDVYKRVINVNNIQVTATDIICDNGVIHVIDEVLSPTPKFNPRDEAGVSAPYGYFDPLGLSPENKRDFAKYREAELKHGRVAMLAFLGILAGERFPIILGHLISGPAIYQYQQAAQILPAFTLNVVGFILSVEGYNIVKGWESPAETSALGESMASLKPGYTPGDLNFDPLAMSPRTARDFKDLQTKELNNGRLAMIAVAGIVVQELLYKQTIF